MPSGEARADPPPSLGVLVGDNPSPTAIQLLARSSPEVPPLLTHQYFPVMSQAVPTLLALRKEGTAQTTTGPPASCGLPEGKAGPLATLPCPFNTGFTTRVIEVPL